MARPTGEILGRTATGAAAGSVFGPIGTGIGGGLGLLSGLLSPGDKSDSANRELLERMQRGARQYEQYRPIANQARMAALGNRLGAHQGTSNALATLYGPSFSLVGPAAGIMNAPFGQGSPNLGPGPTPAGIAGARAGEVVGGPPAPPSPAARSGARGAELMFAPRMRT